MASPTLCIDDSSGSLTLSSWLHSSLLTLSGTWWKECTFEKISSRSSTSLSDRSPGLVRDNISQHFTTAPDVRSDRNRFRLTGVDISASACPSPSSAKLIDSFLPSSKRAERKPTLRGVRWVAERSRAGAILSRLSPPSSCPLVSTCIGVDAVVDSPPSISFTSSLSSSPFPSSTQLHYCCCCYSHLHTRTLTREREGRKGEK
mmetsp:Transcript_33925/g.87112  ORF Transcript_33925/g.87112 Transcript_33925/m.87112 type:complete len:203 (-) Transcript_33925:164-772(-)